MTENELIRERLSRLENTLNDIVSILRKKVSAGDLSSISVLLEGRLAEIADRLGEIESRLVVLEEDS